MAEEANAEAIAKDARAEISGGAEREAASSVKSAPTVREFFALPEKETDSRDDDWQAFEEKVKKEVEGVKWTAAMPDLVQKICELLDISIPDIFMAAWKKAKELQEVMEKSRANPEDVTYLELTEHTLNSEHKPSVDVRLKGATIKKIQLDVQLGFKLKGFVLKIQDGGIREMQTGHCEAKGSIKYGGLQIAEKKLEPIKLPYSIPFKSAAKTTPIGNETTALKAEEKKPEEPSEVERIEL